MMQCWRPERTIAVAVADEHSRAVTMSGPGLGLTSINGVPTAPEVEVSMTSGASPLPDGDAPAICLGQMRLLRLEPLPDIH